MPCKASPSLLPYVTLLTQIDWTHWPSSDEQVELLSELVRTPYLSLGRQAS